MLAATECRGCFLMRRSWRLRNGTDFARVRENGRVWRHPLLALSAAASVEGSRVSRVGITVSRRVGTAVVRNRVKRRLREILRLEHPRLVEGWDLVIVVRPAAAKADFAALSAAALSLLQRAGLSAAVARQAHRTGA